MDVWKESHLNYDNIKTENVKKIINSSVKSEFKSLLESESYSRLFPKSPSNKIGV